MDAFEEIVEKIDLDKDRIIAETDHLARKNLARLDEIQSETVYFSFGKDGYKDEQQLYFFFCKAGLDGKEVKHRLLDISFEIGALNQARRLAEQLGDNETQFKAGKKFAKRGNYQEAFNCFQRADLERVNTNDRLFYETIAQTFLPALIDGVDPQLVKDSVNDNIKKYVIRDITVADGIYTVDFGAGKYSLEVTEKDTPSRNGIDNYTHGFRERETVKRDYRNKEALETERFWLKFLEGKVPIKRMTASRDDKIQLETSHGLTLFELQGLQEIGNVQEEVHYQMLLSKAAKISRDLYRAVNERDIKPELEGLGIPYKLERDYIDGIFTRFFRRMEGNPLLERVRSVQAEVTECLLDNRKGIIHNDYSPQNLMVEENEIIVIDHEDYREGHPLMQMISLYTYPNYADGVDCYPVRCRAKELEVDENFVAYGTLFCGVRRAGAIPQKPKFQESYDYFIGKIEGVLA